jgi:hypothetical protein
VVPEQDTVGDTAAAIMGLAMAMGAQAMREAEESGTLLVPEAMHLEQEKADGQPQQSNAVTHEQLLETNRRLLESNRRLLESSRQFLKTIIKLALADYPPSAMAINACGVVGGRPRYNIDTNQALSDIAKLYGVSADDLMKVSAIDARTARGAWVFIAPKLPVVHSLFASAALPASIEDKITEITEGQDFLDLLAMDIDNVFANIDRRQGDTKKLGEQTEQNLAEIEEALKSL